jgi:hypothetical protein
MADLLHLRQLAERATPLPWYLPEDSTLPRTAEGDIVWPQHLDGQLPFHWARFLRPEDAELIVRTRNALPVLLAAVEAARSLLASGWSDESALAARADLQAALQRLEEV